MTNIFSVNKHFFQQYSNVIQIVLLSAVFIASSWSLVIPGIGVGHDLNHQARIFEITTGLREGVFPVIWSQHLGYGVGMPLFQFYAPLPYYVGSFWHLLGFNLTISVEMMTVIANLLTIIGSYLLAKELFKSGLAAVLSATILTLAPYRAVDLYVRTAISEGWAIALLPFVLWGIVLTIHKKKLGVLVTALSFAALILSHNLTALLGIPFLVIFGLGYLSIQNTAWKISFVTLLQLIGAGIIALGLTAFYFIPALAEKDFTQVEKYTVGNYYDFRQHFLYIRQFIEPWGEWEFGGSGWGPNDEMSFFLGYGQLVAVGVALSVFIFSLKKNNAVRKKLLLHGLLFVCLAVSLALTLLKAQPIWELFSFSAYFQFPWRLLAISVVFIGLIAGSTLSLVSEKLKKPIFFTLYFLTIVINVTYFKSEKYFVDTEKFSNYDLVVTTETSSNLFDYIPKDINFLQHVGHYVYPDPANKLVPLPITSLIEIDESITRFDTTIDQSTKKVFTINVPFDRALTVHIAYYPGWTVYVNGQKVDVYPNQYGLLTFPISEGTNDVTVVLEDTTVRFWSKILTIITASLLVLYYGFKKRLRYSYRK